MDQNLYETKKWAHIGGLKPLLSVPFSAPTAGTAVGAPLILHAHKSYTLFEEIIELINQLANYRRKKALPALSLLSQIQLPYEYPPQAFVWACSYTPFQTAWLASSPPQLSLSPSWHELTDLYREALVYYLS